LGSDFFARWKFFGMRGVLSFGENWACGVRCGAGGVRDEEGRSRVTDGARANANASILISMRLASRFRSAVCVTNRKTRTFPAFPTGMSPHLQLVSAHQALHFCLQKEAAAAAAKPAKVWRKNNHKNNHHAEQPHNKPG